MTRSNIFAVEVPYFCDADTPDMQLCFLACQIVLKRRPPFFRKSQLFWIKEGVTEPDKGVAGVVGVPEVAAFPSVLQTRESLS